MSLILQRRACGAPPSSRERVVDAVRAVGAMARAIMRRRDVLRLSDLPDHLLKDVGLKRDDIHAALQTSWREDPTYMLATSARKNRCER